MVRPLPHPQSSSTQGKLPPLESGDRLTRPEFERRYHAMPHLKKAELIEGIEGAPELVVEVAASSAANDLYDKKNAYRRNGVQEYIVWQVLDQKLDWFLLREGEYISQKPDQAGILQSRVFPGLWLAVSALLAGDMVRVLTVVQEGLNSPEHPAFVEQLNRQTN